MHRCIHLIYSEENASGEFEAYVGKKRKTSPESNATSL